MKYSGTSKQTHEALMFSEGFAMRLVQARAARGISVQDLAEKIGVSFTTLYRMENGSNPNPQAYTLARLAVALNVSSDYLLGIGPLPLRPHGASTQRVR